MSDNSGCGKAFIVCFFFIWCGAAFGMGYMAYSMGAPIIFPFVAFGMGGLGVLMCLGALRGKGFGQTPITFQRDAGDAITITGDYRETEYRAPSSDSRAVFQVPSKCPECGASISTESVDWVGPLQAQCPYCMATIDVEKRTF
jgi:hypothetical protein